MAPSSVARRPLVLALVLGLVLAWSPAGAARSRPRPAKKAARLVVLHTNDTHGQIYPTDPPESLGGVARRATLVARLRAAARAAGDSLLLLDAGDVNTGTLESDVSKGLLDMKVMNALGYDAMCLGNHEFDLVVPDMEGFLAAARFPVLSANVLDAAGQRLLAPWTILPAGRRKVAVIGLTTCDTPKTSSHGRDWPGRFGPAGEALAASLKEVEGKADAILVLTHLGDVEDKELIAKYGAKVTAWIGGHTHTQGSTRFPDGPVYVRAGSQGRWLGRLVIAFPDRKGRRARVEAQDFIPVDASIPEDPAMAALVPPQAGGPPLAVVTHRMKKSPLAGLGTSSVLGNFMTDALRAGTDSDIAVMNRGGIRTVLPEGEVRERHLYALCPFRNKMFKYTLTAEQVEAVFADCIRLGVDSAGFLEVSGVTVRLGQNGGPVVTMGGKPLARDRSYTLTTSDFMAKGGDGFQAFLSFPAPEVLDAPPADHLVAHARRVGRIVPDPTLRVVIKPGRLPAGVLGSASPGAAVAAGSD